MILEDLGLPVLSLKDAGITADVEENGTTFEENAQIKAKAIMEMTGALVLADDSTTMTRGMVSSSTSSGLRQSML